MLEGHPQAEELNVIFREFVGYCKYKSLISASCENESDSIYDPNAAHEITFKVPFYTTVIRSTRISKKGVCK